MRLIEVIQDITLTDQRLHFEYSDDKLILQRMPGVSGMRKSTGRRTLTLEIVMSGMTMIMKIIFQQQKRKNILIN
jgi:hypothetical protein